MHPDKSQIDPKYYSQKKHWGPSDTSFIARHQDEETREDMAQKHLNTPVHELERLSKEADAKNSMVANGSQASPFEVSGDALARAKSGSAPKKDWDVERSKY